MNEIAVNNLSSDEVSELTHLVNESLDRDEEIEEIVGQLVAGGLTENDAFSFVSEAVCQRSLNQETETAGNKEGQLTAWQIWGIVTIVLTILKKILD